ncbi:type I polyketide synthase [Actinomadura livida]|uniref:Enediyne polyketide synthase n=1 Tax=Actinomadura livida TaxID=79909 RepID=A0A7W7I8F0_9ACTN|nr:MULTISPECIES: type I polyketide synthase [Actinomadura]MBB4772421.1 enediyne polyketide synthase [Actinomadura catellatispora]GGU23064.1 polyketide synthase [Actinomadura livida]
MTRIAIVGMACRYPDATSPKELWENALAGRRAFRRLPDVRMRLADYWDADPAAPDRFYARMAAVIEGYEFDRIGYRVAGSTYRSTDLTHWLALDTAAQALSDAGFPMGEGLPRERVGAIVGNTLTGEFSRANVMRLRWPYVSRTVSAALKEQGWEDDRLTDFLSELEERYKSSFPPIDEDSLAGGLANTIAGRLCNYFDFNGGGYTVDGACSSSLLSVATAGGLLADGDIDVAVAGGVDLSIDPFELIGFAKTGALARSEMRVYDRNSNGFWPGEGCGIVVLMREEDALAAGRRIYATIAGWGISSDGKGGITRPEIDGYRLALRRAYERAGFGIDTVELFEGHGTGTEVGDKTELTALTQSRAAADAARPAAISSIKGMIGHTKAAAGVAGLIKAAMAVQQEVLPPAIGCVEPHPVLGEEPRMLRTLRAAEPWPEGVPVRAGITAMGFGGINSHVVLDKAGARRRTPLDARTRSLARSAQDAELLLLDAGSPEELRDALTELIDFVPALAYAQLADLAGVLQGRLRGLPYRAAVVVSSPEDAVARLSQVRSALDAGETALAGNDGRVFYGHASTEGRIGFLFPGQGSGGGSGGGALRRRFAEVAEVYAGAALPVNGSTVATAVAQPRIITGSLAGLRALSLLGLQAGVAVGHSLGELAALHWAGVMDAGRVLRLARIRGEVMTERSATGSMAGVAAPADRVRELIGDLPVAIAGHNGPHQTAVAGPDDAIEAFVRTAEAAGVSSTRLRVSHAFHSPQMAPSADAFRDALAGEDFGPVAGRVISTVTADRLPPGTDVRDLLYRQITDPVLFAEAVELAAKDSDLLVEVGPGRVLTGLASAITDVPTLALDTDAESIGGLLAVAGAAYTLGADVDLTPLFHGRLLRPLEIGAEFSFFASPCEQAPEFEVAAPRPAGAPADGAGGPQGAATGESTLEMLRRLAATRAELPVELVRDDSHLLDELHLSSITVGQLVNDAVTQKGLGAAHAPTNFATATLKELAEALDELAAAGAPDSGPADLVTGAATWSRAFRVDLDELPLPPRGTPDDNAAWQVFAPGGGEPAERLRRALEREHVGAGVLVCLPEGCAERDVEAALQGAKTALGGTPGTRFVLLQHDLEHDRGAAGLAKTLRLEAPHLRVTIVHAPAGPETVDRVVAEVAATTSFTECYYDAEGVRRVPTLRAMPVAPERPRQPLGQDDVLLVTGGGKGITAECALAVATDAGASLAVLGRSDPADDAELAANLQRMRDAGVQVHYARADVTDAEQVRAAVAEASGALGPVTAVLHGAGRNEPNGLAGLEIEHFQRTFAPKVDGLRNVLDAVRPERLRLLVTFGSIIGRSGLRGEAHYATANEWLAGLTREFGDRNPECRVLCVEWSVWGGVGMGERLSVVESLSREGIAPIYPDEGVRIMRRLVADPDAPPVVVVSGRAEGVDTVRRDLPALPLLRFVERPLIRYHGVELVTEVELNAGTDRYLEDHLLDGNMLFPAVFGMEAMAQVAAATTGWTGTPVIEGAEFLRPIVVPADGGRTVRIAAVVTSDDAVDVAIRSAETDFAADHFRARLRYGSAAVPDGPPDQVADGLPAVPLDPAADLYDGLLFQGRRFQRLRGYHRAAAKDVDADIAADDTTDWFAGFLPGELLLGDPGARDALMHGNQVCVPHGTLLPSGIDRLHPGGARMAEAGDLRYCATERLRDGDTYVYDIAVRDGDGAVVERWEGLRLRAVRKGDGRGPWVPALVGPYMERSLDDLFEDVPVRVAVEPDAPSGAADEGDRRARTALAASRALGREVALRYRTDGKPELDGETAVSASHGAGVTLCVAAEGAVVGCDVETVAERPEAAWQGLLGPHTALAGLLAAETGEGADVSATRVWTALECLQKAGVPPGAPLTLTPVRQDGWTLLASGDLRIATLVTRLRDVPEPVVLAVLIKGRG